MYKQSWTEYLGYIGGLIILFVVIYLTMKILGMVESMTITSILLIFIIGQGLLNIHFWKKLKKK